MSRKFRIAILTLFILGIWTGLACANDHGKSQGQWNQQKNKAAVKCSVKGYTDMHNAAWSGKGWPAAPAQYKPGVNYAYAKGFVNYNDKDKFCCNQKGKCEKLDNWKDKIPQPAELTRVKGVVEEVSDPDSDGEYVITVETSPKDTSSSETVEIVANADTKLFLNCCWKEIEPSDIEIGSKIKVYLKDDKAILVKLEEENEDEPEEEA
ncbi:MAG: hypothetical protein VB084_07010 [Syntrophomonadaceae bacterium]|nr:hypothetical protein [Syntrophomonadaceae bacterium]